MRWLLQKLMTEITRAPRYRVRAGKDFQWSTLWTCNLFRCYELAFGRRHGIRAESAAWKEKGKSVQVCYTWEAALAHMEARLRTFKLTKKLPSFKIIPAPAFVSPNGVRIPSPYLFAVAYDSAHDGQYDTDDVITWSHTTSGTSLAMVVGQRNTGSDTGATCTVAGNAATSIDAFVADGAGNTIEMFYRLGEAAGATTVVVNAPAGSSNSDGCSSAYSGINAFDATARSSQSGQNLAHPLVTTVDNSWVVMMGIFEGIELSAGADTTRRANSPNATAMFDSNAAVSPAGSRSLNTTAGSSQAFDGILASFAPPAAAAAAVDDFTTVTFFN